MNEILETIGVAVVRISHLETQIAAQTAEIERLTAENEALRSELSDWRRWGPAPDWIDLPDPDENDEIALPEGYAIFRKVAV